MEQTKEMELINNYQAKICWIVARLQNTQLEVLNTSTFAPNNEHDLSFQMLFCAQVLLRRRSIGGALGNANFSTF